MIQRRRPLTPQDQDGPRLMDDGGGIEQGGYQPGAVQPAAAPTFQPASAREGARLRTQPVPFAQPDSPLSEATATKTPNQFGNSANLDRGFLEGKIRNAFQSAGRQMTDADLEYWIGKATTPDIYSDEQVRVGWNPYWEDRIRTGSDSSDPRLAGSEGIISNPGQYGVGAQRRADGNMYFNSDPASMGAQQVFAQAAAGVAPGTDPGMESSLRDAVMKLLNPTATDPETDPRSAAFRVAQKRNSDRTRAQMAESAAQSGLTGSGGFAGALRGEDQRRAEAEAAFEAGIAGDQIDEQREGILAALGFGLDQRGQDLQRYGIDTSAQLSRDRLGLDYAALQELANRQAVLAALGYA